jgi:hypothetical protein
MMGALLLAGCAANTPYAGMPVGELSDVELVEELVGSVEGLGESIYKTQLLIATRPDPAYVLTSSQGSFQGQITSDYNFYTMPAGYRVSGTATTQYQYADANAGARLGNSIATMISRSREKSYRKRGQEVWEELTARIEDERQRMTTIVEEFFRNNPDLAQRRTLVTVVTPWVAADSPESASPTEVLESAKGRIEGMERGVGLSGDWFGVLAQTTTLEDGSTVAFNEFLQISIVDDAGELTGRGTLGSGEVVQLQGTVDGTRVTGAVANTTSAINVAVQGVVLADQITLEYEGVGPGQTLTGTAVLLR